MTSIFSSQIFKHRKPVEVIRTRLAAILFFSSRSKYYMAPKYSCREHSRKKYFIAKGFLVTMSTMKCTGKLKSWIIHCKCLLIIIVHIFRVSSHHSFLIMSSVFSSQFCPVTTFMDQRWLYILLNTTNFIIIHCVLLQ